MNFNKKDNKTVQRSRLTLKQKYQLIKEHESKISVEILKEKYKCGKSLIYKIMKCKNKIIDDFLTTQNTGSKGKSNMKYANINDLTYNWLTQALSKNLPVSGSLIQEKAKEIAIENDDYAFKASNGWLESFKNRHKLTFSTSFGESKDADDLTVNEFLEKLPNIIAKYKMADIANCDETALFFRAIPQKTLHRKGERCHGGKHSKERLTILLCCFADGKFEKPLVIGKSQNPRCFKNIKKHVLPVSWHANRKAWRTASIMEQFLINLNKKMVIQKRHILYIFLDNATSHPNLSLSNIQLCFLPPNTTSKTQPLDQGIINAIKVRYRKLILKRLISSMDAANNVSDLVRGVTFAAIFWLIDAIKSLPANVVPNCFRKAGFQFDQPCDDIGEDDIPLTELRELMRQCDLADLSPDQFVELDNQVFTESDSEFTKIPLNTIQNCYDDEEILVEDEDIYMMNRIMIVLYQH